MIYKYGWRRDIPDQRDHLMMRPAKIEGLPESVDLRRPDLKVLDQGPIGSCTANAIANAHLYNQLKENAVSPFSPSRLFIYYNERLMEGTEDYDSGASIRDGIKSISKQGVCNERTWPYIPRKLTVQPPHLAYINALPHRALSYARVIQSQDSIKLALSQGFPIVFGVSVYDSFESEEVAKTGIVPMPVATEHMLGGHAILMVGYTTNTFIFMNSWGTTWGDKGYGYIPFEYVTSTNLACDLWTIQSVKV
jgi:C1A family cysteine protease